MFVILIDAHSKWIEVEPVESAATKTKAEKLKKFPQLMEFLKTGIRQWVTIHQSGVYRFRKSNGTDHIKPAQYHPSSDGLTERAVRQALKKELSLAKQGTLTYRLTHVLFSYRLHSIP